MTRFLAIIRELELGGITIYPNFVASVIMIAIAVAGYWLTSPAKVVNRI